MMYHFINLISFMGEQSRYSVLNFRFIYWTKLGREEVF